MDWYVENVLMAAIVCMVVSWWRNSGRATVGRRVSRLGTVAYFIHSSPGYPRLAGNREASERDEKAYGRWKRVDDAGETLILFLLASWWSSKESDHFRENLPMELLFGLAVIIGVLWFKWTQNTPPAPRSEGDSG